MENVTPSGRFGRETIWVLAMTLLGSGLRLKGLGTLGLDHFDEGIYAQAATWIFAEGGLLAIDLGLVPYAPPGYPVLVGLAYAAIGVSGTAAILVSILAGVLTIPALAWMSRHAFGPGAGAATAALAAMAGPHVVFSRTGLTDATFLLSWSLGMIAGARFLERPGARRAAWFGLLVGLAQLVKYNGWMVGAIVATAVGVGAIRPGSGRTSAPRALGYGLLSATVAALVYAPWFLFVERTTGYAGLLAHHRSYVDGIPGWWPNWQQHMAQAQSLGGRLRGVVSWLSLSIGLAWVGSAIGQGGSTRSWGRFRRPGPVVALALAAASIAAAPANLTWWAALAWSPVLLADRRPSARLAGTWFLAMAASTPLYHPYARLWLPTLAASWVVSGGLIASILRQLHGDAEGLDVAREVSRRPAPLAVAAVASVIMAFIGPWLLPDRVRWFPDPLARSDGIRTLSERLRLTAPPGGPKVSRFHLYARPPLRFYLLQSGMPVSTHVDLESLRSTPAGVTEFAVIDSGMGVERSGALREGSSWGLAQPEAEYPASIAALLDARPEQVYDASMPHLGRADSGLAQRAPPGSGLAGTGMFWLFEAR
ncbi:ArnT family glycosyltransferase [Tautonia plasticadhaerens]|nr:glycosyltransferase family 39 protein [Tautonia plasticadhaerens]